MEGFFYKVKVIHTKRGPKNNKDKEETFFFYNKLATLGWDPNRRWWIDGGRFLNYTTKSGHESIINKNPATTRVADKWQDYLPGNYRFYWS